MIQKSARSPRILVIAIALTLTIVAVAMGQARVVVEVRNPGGSVADGQITLKATASDATYTCQTHSGECEIVDVPGGQYLATLTPSGNETAPPPRTVVIPPAGRVTLRVSTH